MRVVVDARALSDPALAERGIGRYVRCLLDALGDRVVPLRRPGRPLVLGVRRARADVLHTPSIDGVSLVPGAPLVVTLHDLVPLKHPRTYLRTGLRHRVRYAAVKRAARVIVPTQAVAADAERLLGIPSARLRVIHEAPAPAFRPGVAPPTRLRLPERFLLWVGGLDPPDPRKRVEQLAAAVRRRDGLPLVLAGRVGPDAPALAAPGRVFLVGRVSDEELAGLYGAAAALVLPSAEEGFGLPAVEALACGTPVAAFSGGALGEVLAGAGGARLVDPGEGIDGLLDAAEALAGTAATPPRRTWADVAEETWAVYGEVAGA
jgi:alpha-1,3-rhamnosyl/mannosyltransferase